MFSNANSYSIYNLLCSIEKETKVIERQNGVLNRWSQHCNSYKNALRRFENKKKCGLLIKARSDAIDRIFHISLKRKYSSMRLHFCIRVNETRLSNSACRIYNKAPHLRSQPKETVSLLKDYLPPIYKKLLRLIPKVKFLRF